MPGPGAVQDGSMKSLLAKILLAQVVTVIMALVIVALIARASLNRGFIDFLERQEADVLGNLAPTVAEIYELQSGWGFLRDNPHNWHLILRQARDLQANAQAGPQGGPPGGPQAGPPGGRPPGRGRFGAPGQQPLHWLRSMDRLQFRDRLFLLDADRHHLAGAELPPKSTAKLQPVQVDGNVVGWVGFAPLAQGLPPEARQFLVHQVQVLGLSLALGLAVAAVLGFLLARHLSRPVERVAATVTALADGHYEQRTVTTGSDEIARLAATVNRLAETLDQNKSARQRWMADIAHELRTPVAILKGEIEALADGVRPLDRSTVASLNDEIDQLAALVDDLQTLALSDAGALNLQREPLDPDLLVRQAAEPFQARLQERAIELIFELDYSQDLAGDAQGLRRLVHNLLENCRRYVSPGGQVRVASAAANGGYELVVEDSGPGVPADQLALLFERFYRIERGRSRAGGGSGLGLAICRNIVEAHGGNIRAESAPLGGLLVRSWLPA